MNLILNLRGAVLCTTILLTGCASGYQEYYKPMTGATADSIREARLAPPPLVPAVERAAKNDAALVNVYLKRGYVPIGHSAFSSGRSVSENDAIQQAKTVGADLVLIFDPKFVSSTTTNIPITIPTATTSYTSGTATVYGAKGATTALANATTTTYGSTTNYVPITVNRSNYGAIYFIKQRFTLGVFTRDLTDSERQALQSNKGVVISTVVDGSPAFEADLLVGDIITLIDGQPVSTVANFGTVSRKLEKGKTVSVSFVRAGQTMEKHITLGG